MRRILRKKKIVIPVVAALVVTGSAIAAWVVTQSNGDSGRVVVGNITAPTVTSVSASGTDCYPGNSCSVSVTINNPATNPPLKLTGVNWSGAGSPVVEKPLGTANAGCSSSNFTWPSASATLNINVPVGSSTVTIPNVVAFSASAPVACAGSFVYVPTSTHIWTFST